MNESNIEFEQHRRAMYAVCYRILRDKSEAEDATSTAVLKALGNLPKKFTKDARSWLCTVARSVAIDRCNEIKEERRFERTARAEVREDPFRVSQIRLDTRKLLERVMGLVDESLHVDVGLYFDVLFENFTEKQLADHHGIESDTIKKQRRRARTAVRDAAAVVLLTTDPGTGPNRCIVPFSLARNRKDSPELLTTVLTHLRGCKRCQGRRKDRETLLKGILWLLPPAIGLVLDRLLRTHTATKLAAATSVAAVAAVLLLPGTTRPEPDDALPPAPTTTRPVPGGPTPTSTPPPPTTPPEPTAAPTVRPTVAPPPAPAPTTAVPPDSGGGARDDSPPAITGSWVQHRSIVATDHDTCGDEPTSSVVRVTVTPGVTSAVLLLTAYGHTVELRMRGDGSTWDSRVGPVPNEDARGSVAIAVRVVGANGASSVKQLGEICIRPCRSGRTDQ